MSDSSKIYVVGLEAENYMRLKALRLDFDAAGGLVVIGGRNEQGKSAALSILPSTLGGESEVPDVPLRRGADKGFSQVRLSNGLIVKRTYTREGGGQLTITDGDGRKYDSPQKRLSALFGALAFDPLAFARMDGKKQGEVLRQLAGLDFTKQDAARKAAYDGRTDVNRDLKAAEARLAAMAATDPTAPAAEVSAVDLVAELQAAQATNAGNAARRKFAADARQFAANATAAVAAARVALDAARVALDKAIGAEAEALAAADDHESASGLVSDVDTAEIQARIGNVDATNAAVRANRARAQAEAEVKALREKTGRLAAEIERIDADKAAAIAAAKLPVPGLGLDPDGLVLLDGLPFGQASHAIQVKTSCAIGAAQNPTLRCIKTTDGEKLDRDNLALVAEFGREHDLLFLMERVGDGAEVGIVIEDGEVIEDRRNGTADAAARP